MGLEARCQARIQGQWQDGLARLEEKEIVFRGEARVRASLAGLERVRAADGVLSFRSDGADLALRLGAQAERWAQRILHPPSRLDKLGIKEGMRIGLIGMRDADFAAEVVSRGATIAAGRAASSAALILLSCRTRADLGKLSVLSRSMPADGAIWVLWPKGQREVREQDVREAALPLGLVDVKVAAFSDALSALKLMIRRERRPRPAAAAARRRSGRRG